MLNSIKPITFMLVSTLGLSISSLIAKLVSGYTTPELLYFLRITLPAILMIWLIMMTRFEMPQLKDIPPLLGRAMGMTASQFCFIYAIPSLSLMESVVLFSTGPLFIPVLEKILFKTKIQNITIIALLVAFSGVVVQAGGSGGINLRPELLIGLGAGFGNALAQVCMFRSTKGNLSPLGSNMWCMSFAAIMAIPVVWYTTEGAVIEQLNVLAYSAHSTFVLAGIILIAIMVISTQIFRVKAYQLVDSGNQLAPLILTNLLYSFLWQRLFFEAPLEQHKLVGMGLIVAGLMMISFRAKLERFFASLLKMKGCRTYGIFAGPVRSCG